MDDFQKVTFLGKIGFAFQKVYRRQSNLQRGTRAGRATAVFTLIFTGCKEGNYAVLATRTDKVSGWQIENG